MEWKQLLSVQRQSEKMQKSRGVKTDSDSEYKKDILTEFDDDFLSIISSQAFRRLQDKTQVFLLDKSDFVRTRLTHSLEVSTIARQLTEMIIQKMRNFDVTKIMIDKVIEEIPGFEHAIGTVAACAGLLHDTGNPPYGHYGENVIRKWFEKQFQNPNFKYRDKPIGEMLTEQMKADFTRFEGNAQGLRIMAKSRHKAESHDINLTYAVMNTLVKYPNPSDFTYVKEDVKKHKNGYYHAEEDLMREMCTATGTLIDAEKNEYVRHPLVYVMEAADDIAYATADLEDAVMKHCFTVDEFIQFYVKSADEIDKRNMNELIQGLDDDKLKEKVREYNAIRDKMKAESRKGKEYKDKEKLAAWVEERNSLFTTTEERKLLKKLEKTVEAYNTISGNISRLRTTLSKQETRSPESDFVVFENWLTSIRSSLMNSAAFAFSYNYDAIMAGTYKDDLFVGTFVEDTIHILKAAMAEYVYDCDDLVEMELAAKKVVETLLENFVEAVLYYEEDESRISVIDDRFIRKIPSNFKEDYKGAKAKLEESGKPSEEIETEKLYLRLLMVTDYISGMTDSYASNLYKTINGIL